MKIQTVLKLNEGDKVNAEYPYGMEHLEKDEITYFEGRLLS